MYKARRTVTRPPRVLRLGMQRKVRLVVDSAYAVRTLLSSLTKQGVTAFSRLRKGAALLDSPGDEGQAARPTTRAWFQSNPPQQACRQS